MPKDNFYYLDQNKQALIVQAAFEEFSSQPYMDASINKIVQKSKISRGSFYLYFKDKLDIYFYVIDHILEKQGKVFIMENIEDTPLDIYQIYRQLFLLNLKLLSDDLYSQFFKNLYLGMNYDIWSYIRHKQNSIGQRFLKKIQAKDPEKLSERYQVSMTILELINRDLLSQKIFEGIETKEIIERYDMRISIIKEGL